MQNLNHQEHQFIRRKGKRGDFLEEMGKREERLFVFSLLEISWLCSAYRGSQQTFLDQATRLLSCPADLKGFPWTKLLAEAKLT